MKIFLSFLVLLLRDNILFIKHLKKKLRDYVYVYKPKPA